MSSKEYGHVNQSSTTGKRLSCSAGGKVTANLPENNASSPPEFMITGREDKGKTG